MGVIHDDHAQLHANGSATRSIERLCAIANAYKHDGPLRAKYPSPPDQDILSAGAGWGVDAYGTGKYDAVEVLGTLRDGAVKNVMTDADVFRRSRRRAEPSYQICGVVVSA